MEHEKLETVAVLLGKQVDRLAQVGAALLNLGKVCCTLVFAFKKLPQE